MADSVALSHQWAVLRADGHLYGAFVTRREAEAYLAKWHPDRAETGTKTVFLSATDASPEGTDGK